MGCLLKSFEVLSTEGAYKRYLPPKFVKNIPNAQPRISYLRNEQFPLTETEFSKILFYRPIFEKK